MMEVDHIGIATTDAAELTALYTDLLGVEPVHQERFNGMHVRFLGTQDAHLELLEPRNDGPITQYLDEHGPGIHHVAFLTPSVQQALDRAQALGIDCIDETPRPGAWGHDVAFLHPADTGGVLIEFVEH